MRFLRGASCRSRGGGGRGSGRMGSGAAGSTHACRKDTISMPSAAQNATMPASWKSPSLLQSTSASPRSAVHDIEVIGSRRGGALGFRWRDKDVAADWIRAESPPGAEPSTRPSSTPESGGGASLPPGVASDTSMARSEDAVKTREGDAEWLTRRACRAPVCREDGMA